ncbi:hypothetical protein FRC96_02840 [Lujinxingia vulgaris]|uniref:Surface carbohydrate biosynthesis protein n=1 Tax=Lujinxingia vulgaris TaxID=2600176 RepID=A0A5C6XKI6_9DELT|nr:surface carbohydrate biosynthesis protein [Lujinxingia vulgaris]TXD42835.1 hypothetical protein FRC96_02840 [Lujinxingia vulgaris]
MSAPIPILFPVETINRELDFRLAMAVQAARAHNRIYIGQHETLMRLCRLLDHGVYFGKNAIRPHFPDRLNDYNLLKSRGFRFIHLDTEGAVYPGTEDRWREVLHSRIDPRHLAADDYLLTWGDFQRDTYRARAPHLSEHIRTTGHPGFDLYLPRWRPYFEADTARQRHRYGDFILINTNLARTNNRMGRDFVFSAYNGFDPENSASRRRTIESWARQTEQLSRFVRLVHELSLRFRHQPIVLRPHPSEDPALYERIFAGLPHVHVLHEGAVAPWLLAARCVIHDGCTTGLEAHLAGRPVINFNPGELSGTEPLFLPNLFGQRCASIDEVLDAVASLTRRPPEPQQVATHAGAPPAAAPEDPRALALLHNFRAEAMPLAMEILHDAQRGLRPARPPSDALIVAEELAGRAVEATKSLARPLSPRHRVANAYARGKFPGFDPRDIARRLARVQALVGRSVSHRVISPALIIVEPR